MVSDRYAVAGDPSLEFVRAHMSAPGAETAVDAALRLDSEIMLVDDPVKRVDNMSMAWGLEARVPFLDHDLVELAAACPPELKLADGGKGVLKRSAAGSCRRRSSTVPRATSRCPRSPTSRARCSTWSATRWPASRPASAGCSAPSTSRELLDDPNGELTPLGGNKLWQLGLLELWLQTHAV